MYGFKVKIYEDGKVLLHFDCEIGVTLYDSLADAMDAVADRVNEEKKGKRKMANTKFDVGDEILVRGKIIGIGITEEGVKYTVNIDPEDIVYPGSSFEFDEKDLRPVM